MELVKADSVTAPLEGFMNLPMARQLLLIVVLAASLTFGGVVFMWSQQPNYGVLYGNLSNKDVTQVMDYLQQQSIKYRLDEKTGALMVPADKIHQVRIQLASQGLPHSSGVGLDMLQEKQEFGTSQFIEVARYQHALEGELARSIMTLNNVENARVHLALPKQSAFIRERQEPSASVLLSLYAGRTLDDGQVAAITNLVASSIPNLDPSHVTVVDQMGRLLTTKKVSPELALNQEQFDYTHKLENVYTNRIENILSPIVGINGVRAQVSADLDFTVTEQTQESYNPDLPALRSEQTYEEKMVGSGVQGVPGALSNTPPGPNTVPQQANATAAAGAAAAGATAATSTQNGKSVARATKNYELDRTISHSKLATGQIKRLSVAVVVDDKQVVDAQGQVTHQPRTQQEIDRITSLVKEAVGYNAQRGDTVNVINSSFTPAEVVPPLPEQPLWKQPWVMDVTKQVLGIMAVILLLFGVLRPVMRSLATVKPQPRAAMAGAGAGEGGFGEDQLTLGGARAGGTIQLPQHGSYENNIGMIRDMAQQDPKHVAQVIKTWVNSDEK